MKHDKALTMHELCLLHARADRAMRSVVAKQLESHKLTMMEWLVLGVVSAAPKNGLSMSQVAIALDVTLPQITALVTSLIKQKYIKQKVLASDRRGRQVLLSLKGRRALAKLEGVIAEAMRTWSREIPREQLATYVDTVAILARKA